MGRDLEQWGEDHGYVRYTCPECGHSDYTDGSIECDRCGWNSEELEDLEEQENGAPDEDEKQEAA